MTYVLLLGAIVAEVFATSLLKATDGFSRLVPSVFCIVGYAGSLLMISRVVKHLSVGVVYAVWSGVGTALIVAIGVLFLKQSLNLATIGGVVLIVVGVVVVNLSGSL